MGGWAAGHVRAPESEPRSIGKPRGTAKRREHARAGRARAPCPDRVAGYPPAVEPAPHRFPAALRVKRGEDFDRAYALRRRRDCGGIIVYGARNGLGVTRLGLSVSRKVGGAVRRNRVKRLLREAFRAVQRSLPAGLDLVVVARPHDEWPAERYRAALAESAAELDRGLPAQA